MTKKTKAVISACILLISIVILVLGCSVYHKGFLSEQIVICAFGSFLTVFYLWIMLEKNDSSHLRAKSFAFLIVFFHAFNMAVIVFGYSLPAAYRPICAVPMLLTVLFGIKTGLASMVFYSVVTVLFGVDPAESLLLFLIFGVVGSFAAATLKNTIRLVTGTIILVCLYAVTYVGLNYYTYGEILMEDVKTGIIAGLVQLAVFLVFFPFVAGSFGFNFKEKLAKMCSETFPPIAELKKRAPENYKHVVAVAKLAEHVVDAGLAGVNVDVVKAGAMYHEIGQGLGGNYINKGIEICEKYNIPECVQDIVREHNVNVSKPTTKEAAIVMLADTVISSIDVFNKKGAAVPEKSKLIDKIISLRVTAGALDQCELTPGELNRIKQAFCLAWRKRDGEGEVDDSIIEESLEVPVTEDEQ